MGSSLHCGAIHKIYPLLPTNGVNSGEIPPLERSISRPVLGCSARLSARAEMLRESWSGLPAAIRDLPAAFRRLRAAARAVAPGTAGLPDEAAARQKLNAILAQRNEQLDAALENMLQ